MDVLFINRSFWPDAEATGQLLTELCEETAKIDGLQVSVICGQPNLNLEETEFRSTGTMVRNGVTIHRVRHTTFDKSTFHGRVINFVTFLIAATWRALFCKRPDLIVVETDPPLLCLLGWFVSTVRRTKLVCYLQDVYPDIAIELGRLKNNWFSRFLRKCFLFVYRRSDRVVVVGQDMQNWLVNHLVSDNRIQVIENWVDTDLVHPIKTENQFRRDHNLEGKFVAMYSGNLGFTQRFDLVLDAAEELSSYDEIVFAFVGNGVKRSELIEEVKKRKLSNIIFVDYQPKNYLAQSLSAADVHFVLLDRRLTQFMLPSKIYGALASGTPIIGIGQRKSPLGDRNKDSHIAQMIEQHNVGFFVEESQTSEVARCVLDLFENRELCETISLNAREAATNEYSRSRAVDGFYRLLCQLDLETRGDDLLSTNPTLLQHREDHHERQVDENDEAKMTTDRPLQTPHAKA